MKFDSILDNEKDAIQTELRHNYGDFISNLSFFRNGYTASALFRIMQADVPVIIIGEKITSEGLDLLKEIRKYICVISINDAWKTLLDIDIVPDFIFSESFVDYDERLNEAALVTNVERYNPFLEIYKGKIFFYWTQNVWAKDLCEEIQKKCEYPYRYNLFEQFPIIENIYERVIYFAKYMGSDQIYIIGSDEENLCEQEYEKVKWIRNDEWQYSDLKEACHIKCCISDTVERLLPLFDNNGKNEFDSRIEMTCCEISRTLSYIVKIIDWYKQLYEIAIAEIAEANELEHIVKQINECTENIDKSKVASYAINMINQLDNNMSEVDNSIDDTNEIAQVAFNGVCFSEKLRSFFEFLKDEFNNINLNDTEYEIEKKENKTCPTVLIVYGDSQYNVIPNFVDGIKKGIQKLNYAVYLWDCTLINNNGYNVYQNIVGYDFIILLNGVSIDYMVGGQEFDCPRLWYDNENTKVASIFLDHPRRHSERLKYMRDEMCVIYMDEYQCQYIREYMPEITKLYNVPIGGMKQQPDIEYKQKEDKVVFFGSKADLVTITDDINQLEYKDVIWSIIDELIINPHYTVEEAMLEIGRRNGCMYSMEDLMINSEVLLIVEIYIRGYFREKVINEIAKSGIRFEIYGWQSDEIAKYSNVILKEKVSFEDMVLICQNSKFVLNVQPWSKDGAQERIYNAMLGGSISVTDVADSLENDFEDGKSILFYHLERIEELPKKLLYYMEHTEEANEIAIEGYKIASENHTWDNFVKDMMEKLSQQDD